MMFKSISYFSLVYACMEFPCEHYANINWGIKRDLNLKSQENRKTKTSINLFVKIKKNNNKLKTNI